MLIAPVQPIHWNYNNASGVGRKYRVQRPTKVVPPPPRGGYGGWGGGGGGGGGGGTPPVQLGVTGSSPIGVWGGAPEANAFCIENPPKTTLKL